jgi:hypothetical protein
VAQLEERARPDRLGQDRHGAREPGSRPDGPARRPVSVGGRPSRAAVSTPAAGATNASSNGPDTYRDIPTGLTPRGSPEPMEKPLVTVDGRRVGACVDFVNRDGVGPWVVGQRWPGKGVGGTVCGSLGVTRM